VRKGSLLSWDPYLLNLFLDDCKDTQDLGTKFHYSWLIVLITLVGWGDPTYSAFYKRTKKCHATRYTTLWKTSDMQQRKANNIIFTMYFVEMKENIASKLEDPTRGGGGIQEYIQLQSIKAQYVDPGKNGSKEGVVADEILHHNRGSAMGNERLEGGMEGSSRANKRKETIRSGPLTEEEYPSMEYKRNNRAHKANKGECNNKNT
jgi:hypothetical protein